MSFTVYRSSAGSGKTYTLVREYLKLVLVAPGQFRHILSITFTNKAANEMKSRIVLVLRRISRYSKEQPDPATKALLEEIGRNTGRDVDSLVRNAGLVLSDILHHYSEFSVRTIDSFVHRILKNFAFDLNIPQHFDVELDTENIYKQVIDVLISRAGSDDLLTGFLVDFVKTRAEEEKNWQIETELLRIAHWLNMEDSPDKLAKNAHLKLSDYVLLDRNLLASMRKFETSVRKWAQEAMEIIDSVGIPHRSFSYGNRGLPGYFKALASGQFHRVTPSDTLLGIMQEQKLYSTGASREDQEAITAIWEELQSRWDRIQRILQEEYERYILFGEIRKNLYPLAILDTLNQLLTEFKRENNILLISEFNQRIADIVLEEPVPFIYERAGEKFHHFLIDEFQDTSVLQWQNLLPLIENALGSGYNTLLVGDAKQSIYRWRNSEVEQFVRLPEIYDRGEGPVHLLREKILKDHYRPKSLQFNYRSCPEIVGFNNAFFNYVKSFLAPQDAVIYEDVSQQPAIRRTGGEVRILFPPMEEDHDFDAFNYQKLRDILADVTSRGYEWRDVALLCRSNNEGSKLAHFLIENNVPVISSESVRLLSSPKVRLIVVLLRLLSEPGNSLFIAEAIRLLCLLDHIEGSLNKQLRNAGIGKNKEGDDNSDFFKRMQDRGIDLKRERLLTLPLYDLCEELVRIMDFDSASDPFIQFFLDLILEQSNGSATSISDFLEFWDLKKSNLSILVPEGLNAVRIMTIHKAKGLEFPVVIYPFVNEILQKTHKKLWIDLEEQTEPELHTALVNSNKAMEQTSYREKIVREQEKSLLDMVNLLYVTFSRPTDYLYILADRPKSSHSPPVSVPSLLVGYLKERGIWQEEQHEYSFGTAPDTYERSLKEEPEVSMIEPLSFPWRNRVLLSYQAPANWDLEGPEQKQEWGNLIHRILSRIMTPNDLDAVLKDFYYDGTVDEKEFDTLKGLIAEFLGRQDVKPYFKADQYVRTETEIITVSGKVLRPDRIITDGARTVVVDFKTGNPSGNHISQMKNYVEVVREMNYSSVTGIILYLNPHAPVEIN